MQFYIINQNNKSTNDYIYSKQTFYKKHNNLNQAKSIYLLLESHRDSLHDERKCYYENKLKKFKLGISPETKKTNYSYNRIISTARNNNTNKTVKSY